MGSTVKSSGTKSLPSSSMPMSMTLKLMDKGIFMNFLLMC